MVKKKYLLLKIIPTGDFEFGIGVFRIWDWILRIGDWGKINIGKTTIRNVKSIIGSFITRW